MLDMLRENWLRSSKFLSIIEFRHSSAAPSHRVPLISIKRSQLTNRIGIFGVNLQPGEGSPTRLSNLNKLQLCLRKTGSCHFTLCTGLRIYQFTLDIHETCS